MQLVKTNKQYNWFDQERGDVFGRLTLTGKTSFREDKNRTKRRRIVEAKCECGNVKWYIWDKIMRGESLSCGCLRRDVARENATTHNQTRTLLYMVYIEMKQRCYNPKNKSYQNYGGRGITVYEEWRNNYQLFHKWSHENGYKQGLETERVDNNGNYEPSNLIFTTRKVQSRNKRTTRFYTAFGETKCLWDWAKDERCKISDWGLRNRMDRGKWEGNFEGALTAPETDNLTRSRNTSRNVYLTAFGETKCMSEWLEDERCKVKIDSLRDRLKKGMGHEEALSKPPRVTS